MMTLLIRRLLHSQNPLHMRAVIIACSQQQINTGPTQNSSNFSSSPLSSNTENVTKSDRISKKFELSPKPSDLNKYLQQLKLDVSTYQRVNYEKFHGLVNAVVKDYLSQSEGVFLLTCCTMLPDTNIQRKAELIDKIWNDGVVRFGRPTKEHIIALLRAYKIIGRNISDFNEFLTKYECEGDVELYEEFLLLSCENGQTADGIVKVLADIKDRGFPLTENLFNALILGHSKNGNVETCEKVFETMISANVKPSAETYMQLIRAYIDNGDAEKANAILNERGDSLNQEQVFAIIRTASMNDSVDLMKKAMTFLPENTLRNKHIAPGLRNICIELINMGKSELGYSIVDNLPIIKFGETEDIDSWGVFFMKEMLRCNVDWRKVVVIARRLIDSGRNPRALHCCCEIMLRINSPNALNCVKMLGQTEPLRPHYFWPLFVSRYHSDGETGILNVLREMKKLEVSADQDTLVNYVLAKLPITMKDTKQGIRSLEDCGVPIGLLLTPLLCNLLKQFKVNESLSTLKVHKAKVYSELLLWPLIVNARNFRENSPFAAFAELVHVIQARNQKGPCDLAGYILMHIIDNDAKRLDANVLVSILEQFCSIGIKIPTATCDPMLEYVQKHVPIEVRKKASNLIRTMLDKTIEASLVEQAGILKHPRDMTLDELECHLIELQSKNLNTRGVLRRILQLSVRAGKLERALEMKQLCKEKNVEFSPGMLASMLDLMIRTKNLNEAEVTLEQLHTLYPAFPIDEFKLIDLASLLIESDQIEKAKKLLEKRTKSKPKGGPNISKNLWVLLSNVSTSSAKTASTTNQSKEFLDFLIKLGYCNYDNILLGPIIREHLLKKEVKEAVAEFKRIAETHKKTPMHFELMTTLIEISNSSDSNQSISALEAKDMLSQVFGIVSSVHGASNGNVSLVVAFAKAGSESQLRKILIDPKLEINSEMIMKQCEYLSASGAETTLLKLAKCSRGLGRISTLFNEQDLYNLLLNEYVRGNNVDAALALFERINEDEGCSLTKEFTIKVSDLLEKNNLEIPTVLKMRLRKS